MKKRGGYTLGCPPPKPPKKVPTPIDTPPVSTKGVDCSQCKKSWSHSPTPYELGGCEKIYYQRLTK